MCIANEKVIRNDVHLHAKWSSRWWFQIFFIFTPTWGRFPFWLIFFKWVESTNQKWWTSPCQIIIAPVSPTSLTSLTTHPRSFHTRTLSWHSSLVFFKQLTGWWQLKVFLFSSLFGEMIQFDEYFSIGLVQPPTSLLTRHFFFFIVSFLRSRKLLKGQDIC